MTVRPAWLQAVAPHRIPPGQIEVSPGIEDLRSDQAAQNVGLAAAEIAQGQALRSVSSGM